MTSANERQFILLGVLLQLLHPLFGITAFFGLFLNITRLPTLKSEIWQDHCRWQITTFWVGTLLYAVTIIVGFYQGIWWPFVIAAMWVSYRIFSGAVGVAKSVRVPRMLGRWI